MFPSIRQRIVIVLAVVIGGAGWLLVLGLLRAADGSSGISLASSAMGVVGASAMAAVIGLPTLGLGLFVSVLGNPLSGFFAVAAALSVLAGAGGSIDGWMRREQLPAAYGGLMIETVIWQMGVAVMLILVGFLRSPLRVRWPALAFQDHLGTDTDIKLPGLKALGAGLVCAIGGVVLGSVLIRNSDTGQVIGSLVVAFGIGGFAAQMIFPQTNPVPVLFAPAVVAAGAYAYVLQRLNGHEQVLQAVFRGEFPGLALALPVHYMSAGLMGCTIGMGVAQSVEASGIRSVEQGGAEG
jgi:hypothetical protein